MLLNYECLDLCDGKRIPTRETLCQELVVCPHLIGGHGKLLYDRSVSVRHIVHLPTHVVLTAR